MTFSFSLSFFFSAEKNDLLQSICICWSNGLDLKPPCGSNFNSACHPSEVDQMKVRSSWGLSELVEIKLSPRSGSAALK